MAENPSTVTLVEHDGLRSDPSIPLQKRYTIDSELPPFNELFAELTPYVLEITRAYKAGYTVITGSHEGTLKKLVEYFGMQWTASSSDDWSCNSTSGTAPIACVGPRERHYQPRYQTSSSGQRYFRGFTLHDHDVDEKGQNKITRTTVNPAFILAFAQGVLGYKLLHVEDNAWYLQRDEPFPVSTVRTPTPAHGTPPTKPGRFFSDSFTKTR
jgi:hypothetical protein